MATGNKSAHIRNLRPQSAMVDNRRKSRTWRAAAIALAASLAITACDTATTPVTAVPPAPKPRATIATPAAVDPIMGRLSAVARQIVIALRDSTVRDELADSLRSPSSHGEVDLSACSRQSLGQRIFDRGEFFGGGLASSICGIVARVPAVLYIDRTLLAG